MDKEEEMSEREKITDFKWSQFSRHAIVIRPSSTAGCNKGNFPMEKALQDVLLADNLVHDSTISYYIDDEPGPFYFKNCGGSLKIDSMRRAPRWLRVWTGERHSDTLTVSCPRCNMLLWLRCREREVENFMFRLMFKQVFPASKSLNFINFTDAGYRWADGRISKDDIKYLQELGLVSVWADILRGGIESYSKEEDLKFDFTLTIIPGAKTFENFGGYDSWARLLVQENENRLKAFVNNEFFPIAFGPKPEK